MRQRDLPLLGGSHIGPLFVLPKRRAPKVRMAGLHRLALVKRRTPAWADMRAICYIYAEAIREKLKSGVQQSVDHIVPLNHPLVCGLHVENNLRVIPLLANLSRGNSEWWPDAPFEQKDLWNEPA